jgi:ubiquinone/menaquinone biosynthesis C-methylase UbiE
MHYGYWLSGIKNRNQAMIEQNKVMAEELDIKSDDIVLDAGCGVGGSAIWVAENYGAKVTGITIVEKQVRLAKKYTIDRGMSDLVSFENMDFCKTSFPDDSFDKIYAIESVCHAKDKEVFLKEMFRVLKPGGKICIMDYFLHDTLNAKDLKSYKTVRSGWALNDIPTKDAYYDLLENTKFSKIKFHDYTKQVLKSARFMSVTAAIWLPIDLTLRFFRLISEENLVSTKGSIAQYYFFKHAAAHGLIVAQKLKE